MDEESPQPHRVRMFPDCADTVLWFDGPVDYADSGLSAGLVADLREWERSCYSSLTRRWTWRSRRLAHAHTAAAERLARRVAAELGPRFEVQFDGHGDALRHVRAVRPAENAEAEAAFTALAAEQERERERLAQLRADSGGVWSVIAPLSGAVFRPRT